MFPELATQRFLLQQVLPEDQQFVFEGLSHPDVIPFYGVRYDTLEATTKQMEWYEKSYNDGTGGPWKIVGNATGEKIGVIANNMHCDRFAGTIIHDINHAGVERHYCAQLVGDQCDCVLQIQ